ncbi:MAG: hypothetical protein AAF806_12515 [Bacteroidota bacterium]
MIDTDALISYLLVDKVIKNGEKRGATLSKNDKNLSRYLPLVTPNAATLSAYLAVDKVQKKIPDISPETEKRINALEAERDDLKQKVDDLEVERDDLKQKVNDLEAECDVLKDQLKTLKAECNDYKEKVKQLTTLTNKFKKQRKVN